jgi:hypothetical protein
MLLDDLSFGPRFSIAQAINGGYWLDRIGETEERNMENEEIE